MLNDYDEFDYQAGADYADECGDWDDDDYDYDAEDFEEGYDDYDDSMDGDLESGLTSAGFGMDESYEHYDEY